MMTDLPELVVLDVGHGNCAVLRDTSGTIVIDCGPGSSLLDLLDQLGINEIAHILVSHADSDHIGGLTALLSNSSIQVHNIHLNPDSVRGTKSWKDLRFAVKDARTRATTDVSLELTTRCSGKFRLGDAEIEILAPTPEIAMSGVGGQDLGGHNLNANAMSAVVGLLHESHRVAIIAGDIDQAGLDNLFEGDEDLSADILVFPHHGGNPGGASAREFSRRICERIAPEMVVFSIGRGRFANPRPEVIDGTKSILGDVHILCTQLSRRCAAEVPDAVPEHLTSLPAKGKETNSCCGGTIVVHLDGSNTIYDPARESHSRFVNSEHVTAPLCLNGSPRTTSDS